MRIFVQLLLFIILIITMVSGCRDVSKTPEETTGESGSLIQITKEQFKADRMKIGEPTMHLFEDEVRCNGYIMAPANGLAQISTPISGIVQSIKCVPGDYVKKGQKTCTISSIELIEIQKDFIETASTQSRLKSDYERSKALYDEKIGAEKDFLAIENEYKAINAKFMALEMQLQLLNLNTSEIETGKLYADFPVISPINGYITKQNLQLGQYIEKQISLFEIVDVDQLQLQLSVFEKDVYKLIPGQPVSFGSAGQSSMVNQATLTTIGKAIDPETMTIPCIASINREQKSAFINRTYVEAAIVVDQINAMAVPADAILKSGKDNVVLVLEKTDDHSYYVSKETVTVGRISNGFAEITDKELQGKILIEGVYNIRVD